MRALLALALTVLPAWADPCADVTDEAAITREDAVAAETAADPARYREAAAHWSPDFAFEGMVVIEAVESGERVARTLARVLPKVDAALGLIDAAAQIAPGGSAPQITIRLLDTALASPDDA